MQRKASLWVLAIVLAALLLFWIVGRESFVATRSVVMVTRDLAAGDVIARPMLDFRELPEAYIEDRHVPADGFDRVLGMRLTASLASGATLLWSDLAAAPSGRALSAVLQVGMRALALPAHEAAERWLRAGDRVDVMFTPRVPEDGTPDDRPSVVLLENALVIEVGNDTPAGAVTLSVNPRDALRIVHTQGRGVLRLALRNPRDLAMAALFDDARGEP